MTSKRSSLLLFFCSGTLDQVTKLVVVVFSIGFLMGTILKIWKKRAPQNDRDLSGQKFLNFRGVLIGDKTDAWIFYASKHQAASIKKLGSKTLARN